MEIARAVGRLTKKSSPFGVCVGYIEKPGPLFVVYFLQSKNRVCLARTNGSASQLPFLKSCAEAGPSQFPGVPFSSGKTFARRPSHLRASGLKANKESDPQSGRLLCPSPFPKSSQRGFHNPLRGWGGGNQEKKKLWNYK